MSSARRGGAGGFTLIEVLVALAIVGLALAAVGGVFRNGILSHETASGADAALALAEERLAIASVAPKLVTGTVRGDFGGGFAWRTTIAPYEADAADKAASLRVYRIDVAVDWRDGHRDRHLGLSTLRLGSAAP
jgi:general secretion pathway protein I